MIKPPVMLSRKRVFAGKPLWIKAGGIHVRRAADDWARYCANLASQTYVGGMKMPRRLIPNVKSVHALEMTRIAVGNQKLVYVLVADRSFAYEHGKKSKIAYIGTTKNGAARIAGSTADKAKEILNEYGVTKVTARILTCKPRRNVRTWKKLETALLIVFRSEYGRVPLWNSQGKKLKDGDIFHYFSRETVRKRLLTFDQ